MNNEQGRLRYKLEFATLWQSSPTRFKPGRSSLSEGPTVTGLIDTICS